MPDDSSPDFKASQSAHALEIRQEASYRKIYGGTWSQARAALQKARDLITAPQRQFNDPPPVDRPLPFKGTPLVSTTETKLDAPRFINREPDKAPALSDSSISGTPTDILDVNIDGELYLISVPALSTTPET